MRNTLLLLRKRVPAAECDMQRVSTHATAHSSAQQLGVQARPVSNFRELRAISVRHDISKERIGDTPYQSCHLYFDDRVIQAPGEPLITITNLSCEFHRVR